MFNKFINDILELNTFEKKDILNEKFLLIKEKNMEIYYAPHNEIINDNAKIFIIGITPGWTQTKIAYETAYKLLLNNSLVILLFSAALLASVSFFLLIFSFSKFKFKKFNHIVIII